MANIANNFRSRGARATLYIFLKKQYVGEECRERERERDPSLSRVAARDVARGCLLSLAVHFSPVSLSLSLSLFFLLLIPSPPFSPFNLSLSLSLGKDETKGGGEGRKKRNADKRREREREEVAHFLLCLSIGEGSPRTLFFRSLSLSLFPSLLLVQRELAGRLPLARHLRTSRSFDPESISARVPGGTSRSQLRQLRSSSMSVYFLSVFLSVGARSRGPATGRINSHARVSVAVSVHAAASISSRSFTIFSLPPFFPSSLSPLKYLLVALLLPSSYSEGCRFLPAVERAS